MLLELGRDVGEGGGRRVSKSGRWRKRERERERKREREREEF